MKCISNTGTLYVADGTNYTIRKITSGGVVTTLAGSPGFTGFTDGTGSVAPFWNSRGVAVNSAGTVYVADTRNDTIRAGTSPTPAQTPAGDFNGDRKADILWTNTTTGERSIWFMNGSVASGGASLGVLPVAWVVSGTGDFNGDGKADILLSNTSTGDRVMWLMNGSTISANAFVGTVPVEWSVSGTGDYNGDGKADIFWTNTATGDRAVWLMSGSTVSGGGFLSTVPVVCTVFRYGFISKGVGS